MALHESLLARKMAAFVELSAHEIALLDTFHRRRRRFPEGGDLLHEGQADHAAYILAEGWACSYKILRGGTRQIVDFKVPGDFMGLHSVLFRLADRSVTPLTPIEATPIRATDLLGAVFGSPRLMAGVLWAASRDEAMLVERLVGLGRRDAAQRTAHLFLELGARLSLVGIGNSDGYACPLSQYHLADALGLTSVHINRVLRVLRERELVNFRNGLVVYGDFDALLAFADFDRGYLDHSGPLFRSSESLQPAP